MNLKKEHNHIKYKTNIKLKDIHYDYSFELLEILYRNNLTSSVTIDFEKQIKEVFSDDYNIYKKPN